ncbi:hypothetical protein A5893_12690 [Pedobacter psychrophilus]|uniref:Dihydrolipoamide dehydrogenase n=1 Tax=Pedobacter psychrophilus TaxID=1826909 RepID=A0A179DCX5_9SPHI|nr:DUF2911 domain-containing protein [Pedobacter psychrophilus]OAQ38891.1 hypothetical protein A5893_12690 [Pedobacter psychrophilus]
MKKTLSSIITFLAVLICVGSAKAQSLIPNPSSGQTIIQDFGLGKVTLNYYRPNVKGRKIFGGLESYGAVWRTGANNATTIMFTDEVVIAGNKVSAGKYSLFTIPEKESWTIILNKTADQWGAYDYKKEDDLLRFTSKPIITKEKTETFTMQFSDVTSGSMNLNLMWENVAISIPMTVDYDSKVMENIDKAMMGEKKPYFAAAQYYYSNGKDLNKALSWINEAEKSDTKAPWFKLWKARIQLKMGDKKAAAETAKMGIEAAKEAKNDEYIKLNQNVLNSIK